MRIWVNSAVIKKYLVEFKGTIPYYGDHKSYPPVQKESCIIGNKMSCNHLWVLQGPFPGCWQSHIAQKGSGHLRCPGLHQQLAQLPAGPLQISLFKVLAVTTSDATQLVFPFVILSYHRLHGKPEKKQRTGGEREGGESSCGPRGSQKSVKVVPLVSAEDIDNFFASLFWEIAPHFPKPQHPACFQTPYAFYPYGLPMPSFIWG